MGVVLEDIRKTLLEKLGVDAQTYYEADYTYKEAREFVATLSTDDIAKLVRELNQEFGQNQEAKDKLEKKNYGLRKLIMAIQVCCPHSNEEVASKGSRFAVLVCKFCGRLRTCSFNSLSPTKKS